MIALLTTCLGGALAAALLSERGVAALVRLAPRLGLLDHPNERSSHQRITPRGGGLGVLAAIGLGLGLWPALAPRWRPEMASAASVNGDTLLVAGAACLVAGVSLRDDLRSLPARLRLVSHLLAAVAAVTALGGFAAVEVPYLGPVRLGPFGTALAVVWIVGLTNVYNFLDGIDGLAGVQGALAGLAWCALGATLDLPLVAWTGAVVAGACAGFLRQNWPPARIFLGDVGSATLGFLFATLPLLAAHELAHRRADTAGAGLLPGFALLAVWPFIGDASLTLVRRAARGEPVWRAHRTHLYQRLTTVGWSHASVSGLYAAWAAGCGAVALGWVAQSWGAAAAALGVPTLSLAALFAWVTRQERARAPQG
jgi:UDP-N-acetylmuramyl pentapeptide phosphotransferase/UDP-N-acetylglucosamine-1-phosphate transferase